MDKDRSDKDRKGTVAIIPAAGEGIRMGSKKAKQFLELKGMPIVASTLRVFDRCPVINGIILVVPEYDVGYCIRDIVEKYELDKVEKVVPGGKRRQDSVRKGLEASAGKYELVLIHDGVRPFVSEGVITNVIQSARVHGAASAGLPVKETIKEVSESGDVIRTYDRKFVWTIQTPQAFYYEQIMKAHQKAVMEAWEDATDDCQLMEKMGVTVRVVEGSEENIKITTPHDLDMARFLTENKTFIRPRD